MIKYRNIDLFKSDCNIICHQVNCQGVMGSGIAAHVKNDYKVAYEDYLSYCSGKKPKTLLGQVLYSYCGGKLIAHLFGQEKFGFDGLYTDYDALTLCFTKVKSKAVLIKETLGINIIHIGVPYKIGCDRGGGDWEIVEKMLKELFEDEVDIVLEICKL